MCSIKNLKLSVSPVLTLFRTCCVLIKNVSVKVNDLLTMNPTQQKRLVHMLRKYPAAMSDDRKRLRSSTSSSIRKWGSSTRRFRHLISTLFRCTVCVRTFVRPVTLECGHTFCRDCLSISITSGSGESSCSCSSNSVPVVVCPECRVPVNVTFDRLQCNVLIQRLVSRLTERNGTTTGRVLRSQRSNGTENDLTICKMVQNVVDASQLDCVLCSRCLFEPVTTTCGHTFCTNCLARVLDYGLSCPLCMAPLEPATIHAITSVLDTAIRHLLPVEHQERLNTHQAEIAADDTGGGGGNVNNQVPVFVCTSAFPGVPCPLYVYEPRYRLLARRCLQTRRKRFAMAAASVDGDKFASYGTLLEVRDVVHLHDGRSILTTVGVRRFRVLERGEKDGYDTAKIEYIRDHPVSVSQLSSVRMLHERVHRKALRWVRSLAPRVQVEVEQTLGRMPSVEHDWLCSADGPAWAWWLMPILPLSARLQLGFLSTLSLEKRLRAIDKMLERMNTKTQPDTGAATRQRSTQTNEGVDSCGRDDNRAPPNAIVDL